MKYLTGWKFYVALLGILVAAYIMAGVGEYLAVHTIGPCDDSDSSDDLARTA